MNGDASMVGRGELPDGGLGGFCQRWGNLLHVLPRLLLLVLVLVVVVLVEVVVVGLLMIADP